LSQDLLGQDHPRQAPKPGTEPWSDGTLRRWHRLDQTGPTHPSRGIKRGVGFPDYRVNVPLTAPVRRDMPMIDAYIRSLMHLTISFIGLWCPSSCSDTSVIVKKPSIQFLITPSPPNSDMTKEHQLIYKKAVYNDDLLFSMKAELRTRTATTRVVICLDTSMMESA
jgi:hypothetical protein